MPFESLVPGSVIGILGGGQLGRFLAISAAKLGLKAFIYADEADSPAFQAAWRHCHGSYTDEAKLAAFAKECGCVTFEFENVPAETLRIVARSTEVQPGPRAAEVAQDRIAEKRFLSSISIPLAPYTIVEREEDLAAASEFLSKAGYAILKRSRQGYDGKGQKRVSSRSELEAAFAAFEGPCVLEAVAPFATEISVIAVRNRAGEILCYDCPENNHAGGILRTSAVPARCLPGVQSAAQDVARQIASTLDYVGVLGVEFFVMPTGEPGPLLVNEIAPRVHNSGHWTLDACVVSQFENHIRAVAGWPLGSTKRHSDAVMTNLLGEDVLRWREILERDSDTSLYLYGKNGVRTARKLGHATRISPLKK
jgi:5-(carboxyamino)imidazole ribonucleotide synthase